jgi:hypothetical protein
MEEILLIMSTDYLINCQPCDYIMLPLLTLIIIINIKLVIVCKLFDQGEIKKKQPQLTQIFSITFRFPKICLIRYVLSNRTYFIFSATRIIYFLSNIRPFSP